MKDCDMSSASPANPTPNPVPKPDSTISQRYRDAGPLARSLVAGLHSPRDPDSVLNGAMLRVKKATTRPDESWEALARGDRGEFFGYLKTAIRSEILDDFRRRGRDRSITVDDEEWERLAVAPVDPELAALFDGSTRTAVMDELARLFHDSKDFQLVMRHFQSERSVKSQARRDGVNPNTRSKELRRALATLRTRCQAIQRRLDPAAGSGAA